MSVDAKRVQAVFLAAVEIADAAQRAAYLDQECDADPDLRQRVEALLQAHETPASILAGPVVAPIEEAPYCTLPLDASADQALPLPGNRAQDSATLDAGMASVDVHVMTRRCSSVICWYVSLLPVRNISSCSAVYIETMWSAS